MDALRLAQPGVGQPVAHPSTCLSRADALHNRASKENRARLLQNVAGCISARRDSAQNRSRCLALRQNPDVSSRLVARLLYGVVTLREHCDRSHGRIKGRKTMNTRLLLVGAVACAVSAGGACSSS